MMPSQRLVTPPDGIVAGVVVLGCLGLYVKTLAPTLLMGDAAEFQLAGRILGVAHPTGYPLYLILGWLWSRLIPLGDAAYRLNLLSAVLAACAVGLLYVLLVNVVRGAFQGASDLPLRAVAALGALTLAVSRTYWSQALTAEVYALNSLFVVATLYLLLRWARSRSPRTLQAVALLYGLSLTHHSTMVLFLPALLIFVGLTDRSVFRNPKLVGALLLLVALPQALYLYIPWRAPATPYLRLDLAPGRTLELYEHSLRGFLSFVMAEMFRGELGYQAPLVERLAMAGRLLVVQFGIAGVALGIVGVARLALVRDGARSRRTLVLLVLSYLALVAFTLFYHIGDIHVFYTPSYVIFSIWLALGMGWLVEAAGKARLGAFSTAGKARWALVALLALLPLATLRNNYARVDKSGDHRARQWAEEVLSQPIPEGAILVSNDRNEITPLLYLQHVEGTRPDLLTMFPLMLRGQEYFNVVRVIDGMLDVDRPLFLVKPMPGLEIKYRTEAFGPLVEVLGPAIAAPPAHVTNLDLDGGLVLVGYDLEPEDPSPGDQLKVILHWRARQDLAEDYHTYVHLLDDQGQVVAQSDHRPGQDYYPTSLWAPGEMLRDEHTLSAPANGYGGAYTIVAGAYGYPSLLPLGDAATLTVFSMRRWALARRSQAISPRSS